MAGKRVKCPACAHVWQIPRRGVDAEAVPGTPGGAIAPASTSAAAKKSEWFDDMMGDDYPIAASQSFTNGPAAAAPSAAEPPRRPCPRCGEMIAIGAAKCRFCDAIFDEKLRKSEKKKKRSSWGSSNDSDDLTGLDWVFCILCSGIGCIVGVVYLVLGRSKGGKMLLISIVATVIKNFILFAIQSGHQGPRIGLP